MERQLTDMTARKQALKVRMADHVEKLMDQLEELDLPKTALEVERHARAIKMINAVVDQVFADDEDEEADEDDVGEDEMNGEDEEEDWRVGLERKLHRLVDARRDNRVGGDTEAGGPRGMGEDVVGKPPGRPEGAGGGLA